MTDKKAISTENDTEAWTYAPSLSDAPKHTIYGPRGEVFATVYRSKDRARLIAAAPDLLALAKQYLSECSECNGSGTTWDRDNCTHTIDCPDCADIRAVIAKAEGRS